MAKITLAPNSRGSPYMRRYYILAKSIIIRRIHHRKIIIQELKVLANINWMALTCLCQFMYEYGT
jgi:hypothetical protein